MAEEILTQEEIDLLLKTLGRERKRESPQEDKAKPIDFSLFEHISAGRIPGLDLIFERWISGLKRGLTSLVATIPTLLKESVQVVRFGDILPKLPSRCAIGLFNIEPLRGTCLLIVDPRLLYLVVSGVFGGSPRPYRMEIRDFTRIELKLIHRLLQVCYQELEAAWDKVMEVKINPVGIETNPSLLTVARAREKFFLLKLVVVIEGNEGDIYLAIPESAISPYKDLLKGLHDVRSKSYSKQVLKNFQKIPVKLEVILGSKGVSLKELMELKVGDTIILDKPLKEPLTVKVEGLPKFLAFLGQLQSKRAVKVQEYFKKEG